MNWMLAEAVVKPRVGKKITMKRRYLQSMFQNFFFFVPDNPPTSGLHYKSLKIVIYDRNDSTIVEPLP
jgi:hypothetical protein